MKVLKKIGQFLRSMRFGLVLLLLIAALCVIGSTVEQGKEVSYYETNFGSLAGIITSLGFDHLYSQWYFILLFALLFINLLTCSILRGLNLKKRGEALCHSAENSPLVLAVPAKEREAWLKKHGFSRKKDSGWMRRRLGLAGSFATHLGLLVLIGAAACVFALESSTVITINVGEETTLQDGSVVHVNSFSDHDENGSTAYTSGLTITLPGGAQLERTLSVNNPVSFGRYKLYQSSYGMQGHMSVATKAGDDGEIVNLGETAFLTLDGTNGIYYETVYEYVMISDDGSSVTPVSSYSENTKPMYLVTAVYDGEEHTGMVDVGETLAAGGVYVTFLEPLYSTGIEVKERSVIALGVLYASFGLLLLGLFLCFFHRPMAAVIADDGIHLSGGRETEDLLNEWKT